MCNYDVAQFASGTHYCEGQRLQSFYTSWENPKCTTYTHQRRSYTTTFHWSIKHVGPGPATPSGQPFCHCSSGLNRPLQHRMGPYDQCSGYRPTMPCQSYISFLVPIWLVCNRYCSILAKSGPTTVRSLIDTARATAVNTHVLLQTYTCQIPDRSQHKVNSFHFSY